MFNREFRSYDVLFDSIYLANTVEAKHRIRVPLSSIVDFKGFRAIVLAVPPICPEKGVSFGFNKSSAHFECIDYSIKMELHLVGEVLNLKETVTKLKQYN
jgi:hypothetical protein